MSLARWIKLHETGTRTGRALGGIILLQVALAVAAVAVDLLKLCGACGGGNSLHTAIAATGVLAYALLYILLQAKAWTGVFFGVFAGAGVHLSLLGLMVARGSLCFVCLAAATVSLAGPAVLLFRDRSSALWLARATAPSFLLAGVAAWTLQGAQDARAHALQAEAKHAALALVEKPGIVGSPLTEDATVLHVFEAESCPYCREFKRSYAPRLKNDFPDLAIVYHPSATAPWVRLAPTFVQAGEILFEGLPTEYGDLALALRDARRSQKAAHR